MGITELADLVRAGLADDEQIVKQATAGPWMAAHRIDGTHRVVGGPFPLPGCPSDSRTVCRDGGYPADWPKEVVNPEADADHIARHDPRRVLADVAARRQLLDTVLGWEHYEVDDPWYSCPAAPNAPAEHRTHGCTCGRDERVLQVLQALAEPYQETTS